MNGRTDGRPSIIPIGTGPLNGADLNCDVMLTNPGCFLRQPFSESYRQRSRQSTALSGGAREDRRSRTPLFIKNGLMVLNCFLRRLPMSRCFRRRGGIDRISAASASFCRNRKRLNRNDSKVFGQGRANPFRPAVYTARSSEKILLFRGFLCTYASCCSVFLSDIGISIPGTCICRFDVNPCQKAASNL